MRSGTTDQRTNKNTCVDSLRLTGVDNELASRLAATSTHCACWHSNRRLKTRALTMSSTVLRNACISPSMPGLGLRLLLESCASLPAAHPQWSAASSFLPIFSCLRYPSPQLLQFIPLLQHLTWRVPPSSLPSFRSADHLIRQGLRFLASCAESSPSPCSLQCQKGA